MIRSWISPHPIPVVCPAELWVGLEWGPQELMWRHRSQNNDILDNEPSSEYLQEVRITYPG